MEQPLKDIRCKSYFRWKCLTLLNVFFRIVSLFRKQVSLTDEVVLYSICGTTDIDYFCHMNNGRYLRELDFAR